jgi:hypothetical protein
MKSFNEWFSLRENLSNANLSRITLQGTGGKFKFVIEQVSSYVRNEWFEVDLAGTATMTSVATSASGRTNHILGGLDNKQITRHDASKDPYASERYGFEPTNGSIGKKGTIKIRISLDGFVSGRKQPRMDFNSEWTNWETRGIESIDRGSAITIVDLINQKLHSGKDGSDFVAHAIQRATRNDSRERTIEISVDDLGFHQKIS